VGIFGEREFMGALFPGYFKELKYAGFVQGTLDDALEKRAGCRREPVRDYMHTEHIDVGPDFSDAQLAGTFLHHSVLIIPSPTPAVSTASSREQSSSAASANASSSIHDPSSPTSAPSLTGAFVAYPIPSSPLRTVEAAALRGSAWRYPSSLRRAARLACRAQRRRVLSGAGGNRMRAAVSDSQHGNR
jgi:hypothetical protein